MRRKFDGGVEAEAEWVFGEAETLHRSYIRFVQPRLAAVTAPDLGGPSSIGQQTRLIDQEQRPAVDSDITTVAQGGLQGFDEVQIVVVRVFLGNQNFSVEAIPAPAPVFVGPADAERKIRPTGLYNFVQRPVQQALAGEPIVVVAETVNPVLPGQGSLFFPDFGKSQVVETQIRGQPWLVVADEVGHGLSDVGPFGEALAPPAIIFRDRVVLRQVEGDQPDGAGLWRRWNPGSVGNRTDQRVVRAAEAGSQRRQMGHMTGCLSRRGPGGRCLDQPLLIVDAVVEQHAQMPVQKRFYAPFDGQRQRQPAIEKTGARPARIRILLGMWVGGRRSGGGLPDREQR